MHPHAFKVSINRRSMLGGLALLAAGTALVPTFALAEGGLKGGTADDPAPDDALSEIGITGERSYESPQFAYRLDWSRDWNVDERDPGESSLAEELDVLILSWADTSTEEIAYLNFLGFTLPAANVQLLMDNAEDPETVAEMYGGGYEVEIVLAERDDAIQEVAYHLTDVDDPETQRWMISSVRVLDMGLVLTTNMLLANGDLLAEVSEAFVDGVNLDDEPLIQLLTVDAIQDAYAGLG